MAQATINPTSEAQAMRDVERIKTLRIALAKAKGERAESLQVELDRRLERVRSMKAALAEVDV
jgi:hypothetical protein